jgi:glutathione peroxidase
MTGGIAMIERRKILTLALAATASSAATRAALAQATMSRITAFAFSFPALAGGNIRLSDYAGRPLLIVNTASLCGFTPQYAGLQDLSSEFNNRGLMIVGVPPPTISADRNRAALPILPRRCNTNTALPALPSL